MDPVETPKIRMNNGAAGNLDRAVITTFLQCSERSPALSVLLGGRFVPS
jgi:hypothetical protein